MSTAPVQPKSFTYYHAGPLFTVADLHLNTQLSRRIHEISNSRFVPLLPQDIEPRDAAPDTTPNIPHSIRDEDLRALLSCDLALFTYDGSELDSGTVVEYMTAKFADIPTVILRTDFRGAGDQGTGPDGKKNDPWNLMSSFWPRSTRVVVDSMGSYKNALKAVGAGGIGGPNEPTRSEKATLLLINETAQQIVEAMEEVMKMPSTMPKSVREDVYRWIGVAPGWVDSKGIDADMQYGLDLLKTKIDRGLFPA